MRWLLIGDLHFNLRQLAWLESEAGDYDAVLCSGDLLDVAGHTPLPEQRRVVQAALRRLAERTVVCVASGNHDIDAPGGRAAWLEAIKGPRLFVDGSTVAWNDAAVTLWPWASGLPGGDEVVPYWRHEGRFPTWIWLHHAPPADTRIALCPRDGPLAGNRRLVDRIRRHQPSLVVSGHLHDAPFRSGGGWWDEVGDTVVVNPGHHHGEVPPHIVLDLAAGELAWVTATAREDRPFPVGARLAGVA